MRSLCELSHRATTTCCLTANTPCLAVARLYRWCSFDFTMFNPYITQIMEETGMTEREARRHARHANLTLAQANAYGFKTIQEYEEAILEYIYG